MKTRRFLVAVTLIALILSATACEVTPAMRRSAEQAIRTLIRDMPLTASDLAGAMALEYSPIPFVRLKLDITPRSLTKEALSIDFARFPRVRALARFEFIGDYRLTANGRAIIDSAPLDLVGEGSIEMGFDKGRFFIDDIPAVVLKLAGRPMECPDVDAIRRDMKIVQAGQAYTVSTGVHSNAPGHLAFLVFSNNRAVDADKTVLRTSIGGGRDFNYSAVMRTRPGTAPDTYYGNIMVVELASRNPGNPLDLESYQALFSTGITLIKIR